MNLSNQQWQELFDLLQEAKEETSEAWSKADDSADYASTSADYAESTQSNCDNAMNSARDALEYAEEACSNADSAIGYANDAKDSADEARDCAERAEEKLDRVLEILSKADHSRDYFTDLVNLAYDVQKLLLLLPEEVTKAVRERHIQEERDSGEIRITIDDLSTPTSEIKLDDSEVSELEEADDE